VRSTRASGSFGAEAVWFSKDSSPARSESVTAGETGPGLLVLMPGACADGLMPCADDPASDARGRHPPLGAWGPPRGIRHPTWKSPLPRRTRRRPKTPCRRIEMQRPRPEDRTSRRYSPLCLLCDQLRDLDGVQRRALAQVVGDREQHQALAFRYRVVLADAAHEGSVPSGRI